MRLRIQRKAKEEPKQVVYQGAAGGELPELDSPPKADGLFRGVIVTTPKEAGKKRQLFEIVEIEDLEDSMVARCRPVTPKYLNSVILVAGLIGAWFGIHYILSMAGIGY